MRWLVSVDSGRLVGHSSVIVVPRRPLVLRLAAAVFGRSGVPSMLRDGLPDTLDSFGCLGPRAHPAMVFTSRIPPALRTPYRRCLTRRSPAGFGSASWSFHNSITPLDGPHDAPARTAPEIEPEGSVHGVVGMHGAGTPMRCPTENMKTAMGIDYDGSLP
jgi:hypothetical protein